MMKKAVGFDEWATYQKYHNLAGKRLFVLTRDLMYRDEKGDCHIVRKKSKPSDLGSIPKPMNLILSRDGYPSSYFLHDADCENPNVSRLEADNRLRESLHHSHAPNWKIGLVYKGVRAWAVVMRLK